MKVLITSGGGAKGAFSVGALKYLNEVKGIKQFDLISGTSTGALIATLAAIGKIDTLVDVYRNTQNADVLEPKNLLESIKKKRPYIYDTHPLLKQIRQHIDDNAFNAIMNGNTLLCLNAISLQTGKVTVFSNKNIIADVHYDNILINSRDMLINAMLGSSNQAVFLNPIQVGADQYVDGGNREVVPTRAVVANLNADHDHEIYVLSNNPNDLVTYPGVIYTSILDVLIRAIAIFIQEIRESDMETLGNFKEQANGTVKVFYISPGQELDREFTTGLRFDFALMEAWMQMGMETAKKILDTKPDGNFPTVPQ
ncbi:MAG: patatin-like phospholipase family protein [Bacteroidota bacterium]